MKKSLMLVVSLLCMASLMAAMAFTSASVTNDMKVSLVDTQDALLALEASEKHEAATTEHITSDMLNINLNKGKNGQEFGIQPDSTYTWDDLFKVTNNSENEVTVTIKLNPDNLGRANIFAKYNDNWVRLNNIHNTGANELTFKLTSGESEWIDFKTNSLNGHEADYDFDLIVEAK